MTKDESLKLALEALEAGRGGNTITQRNKAITALREALAQTEKPKYRRGDRLICLETEDYCVIHISGTDRQWVKFPDSHIGVYTNEQVAELFELLPKEPEQEPMQEQRDYSCNVCSNKPDSDGLLEHGSGCYVVSPDGGGSEYIADAIKRPAQPQQEPVAWAMYQKGRLQSFWMDKGDAYNFEFTSEHRWEPLYTTPPAQEFVCSTGLCHYRKPLSNEEIDELWCELPPGTLLSDELNAFARAVEAAHGIKGEA